jgi:hypothetical protein
VLSILEPLTGVLARNPMRQTPNRMFARGPAFLSRFGVEAPHAIRGGPVWRRNSSSMPPLVEMGVKAGRFAAVATIRDQA